MTYLTDFLTEAVVRGKNAIMSQDVRLVVSALPGAEKEELIKIFEAEIDKFSKWMETQPNWKQQGALTRPERVLLLTYFMQKWAGNIDKKETE